MTVGIGITTMNTHFVLLEFLTIIPNHRKHFTLKLSRKVKKHRIQNPRTFESYEDVNLTTHIAPSLTKP